MDHWQRMQSLERSGHASELSRFALMDGVLGYVDSARARL